MNEAAPPSTYVKYCQAGGATMSSSKLDFRWLTVLKDYPEKEHERWEREVWAYQNLSWATPKLDGFNPRWIEMERLVPILDLPYDVARKYRDPLRELLVALHNEGWWHCDVALVNVVIHPTRGPLLIDWENLRERTGEVSYDLYGARLAGIDPAWPVEGGEGVWWGGPWDMCPGPFFGEEGLKL